MRRNVTLTNQNQVTIPRYIQKKANVVAGTEFEVLVEDGEPGRIVLVPVQKFEYVICYKGIEMEIKSKTSFNEATSDIFSMIKDIELAKERESDTLPKIVLYVGNKRFNIVTKEKKGPFVENEELKEVKKNQFIHTLNILAHKDISKMYELEVDSSSGYRE